jgi:hypothetical protein
VIRAIFICFEGGTAAHTDTANYLAISDERKTTAHPTYWHPGANRSPDT